MASVLSNNMNDITQVSFFMEECKRMGIKVAGPDVNESNGGFTVNKAGEIRFGMAAIKGAGSAAVDEIIIEREKNGPYKNIFDFAKRVNSRALNKKNHGSFGDGRCLRLLQRASPKTIPRSTSRRYYLDRKGYQICPKKIQQEEDSAQVSLFGGGGGSMEVPVPTIAPMEPFSQIQQLNIEKEVVGLFISGHPLISIDLRSNPSPIHR